MKKTFIIILFAGIISIFPQDNGQHNPIELYFYTVNLPDTPSIIFTFTNQSTCWVGTQAPRAYSISTDDPPYIDLLDNDIVSPDLKGFDFITSKGSLTPSSQVIEYGIYKVTNNFTDGYFYLGACPRI